MGEVVGNAGAGAAWGERCPIVGKTFSHTLAAMKPLRAWCYGSSDAQQKQEFELELKFSATSAKLGKHFNDQIEHIFKTHVDGSVIPHIELCNRWFGAGIWKAAYYNKVKSLPTTRLILNKLYNLFL